MAENIYEGMFLLDSSRYNNDPEGVSNRVRELIGRHGGEVIASRPWEERRLAYPIRGNRKGMYLLTYFRMDGAEVAELERDCRHFETILRQLILKVDRQLVGSVLAQVGAAEQQHATAAEGNGESAESVSAEETEDKQRDEED